MPTVVDPVLAKWGRNIRTRRTLLAADGTLRQAEDTPPMSQAELGALMDPPVHQSTVARWEGGLMEPRRIHKAQLARILIADTELLFPMGLAA